MLNTDGNGNVTALVTSNQQVAARYLYDPFGNTLMSSGPKARGNRYRFSSKRIHELSGMYDYLYRWYVCELQRWLNADPLEEDGGVNLYTYVNNDPVDDNDEDGLAPTKKKPKEKLQWRRPRQPSFPKLYTKKDFDKAAPKVPIGLQPLYGCASNIVAATCVTIPRGSRPPAKCYFGANVKKDGLLFGFSLDF